MTSVVEKAKAYAKKYHEHQTYGDEETYFDGHLSRVAKLVESLGGDNVQIAIAYLHDILEDTFCPPEEIRQMFGQRIYDAVVALTKTEDLEYKWYLQMLKGNRDAILVKFADSSVNFAKSIEEMNDETCRRIMKYSENIKVLRPLL